MNRPLGVKLSSMHLSRLPFGLPSGMECAWDLVVALKALALFSFGPNCPALRTLQHDEYTVDVWEPPDGLPQNSVTSMAQTPDGCLWLACVNLFTGFAHDSKVFAQADAGHRRTPGVVNEKSQHGQMIPLGTLADTKTTRRPSLIPLYNLVLSTTVNGSAGPGFSSGPGLPNSRGVA